MLQINNGVSMSVSQHERAIQEALKVSQDIITTKSKCTLKDTFEIPPERESQSVEVHVKLEKEY
jgi:hypothetical protein